MLTKFSSPSRSPPAQRKGKYCGGPALDSQIHSTGLKSAGCRPGFLSQQHHEPPSGRASQKWLPPNRTSSGNVSQGVGSKGSSAPTKLLSHREGRRRALV